MSKRRDRSLGLPVCTVCFKRKRPLTELIGVLDVSPQSIRGKRWAQFCDEKCAGYHAGSAPVMDWPGGLPECLDCRQPKLPRAAHIEVSGLMQAISRAYCVQENACYEMDPVPIKDWPAQGTAA